MRLPGGVFSGPAVQALRGHCTIQVGLATTRRSDGRRLPMMLAVWLTNLWRYGSSTQIWWPGMGYQSRNSKMERCQSRS